VWLWFLNSLRARHNYRANLRIATLGVRELAHPHVEEQPFTRALENFRPPAGVTELTIRARDSVHGFGGRGVTIRLPAPDRSS